MRLSKVQRGFFFPVFLHLQVQRLFVEATVLSSVVKSFQVGAEQVPDPPACFSRLPQEIFA